MHMMRVSISKVEVYDEQSLPNSQPKVTRESEKRLKLQWSLLMRGIHAI